MNQRCFLLICIFAAGCSTAPVAENEIQPKKPSSDVPIQTHTHAPLQKTVFLPPKPTPPEQPEATQEKSSNTPASIQPKDDEADKVAKRTDPAEAKNEKADKDSEPSPHDISLPVPEVEETFPAPPTPETKKPKAFLYDVPVVRNAIVDR